MKPGSPQYRTVCIVSCAVLALVLLIAGLIWRAEVKEQALRQQQAVEQAEAEQYRAWYERTAREWRWENPQVGQRAPNPKAKPTTRNAAYQGPVNECAMRHLAEGFRIVDQSGGALDDAWADEYATQQAARELGMTRQQLEEAEKREFTAWWDRTYGPGAKIGGHR